MTAGRPGQVCAGARRVVQPRARRRAWRVLRPRPVQPRAGGARQVRSLQRSALPDKLRGAPASYHMRQRNRHQAALLSWPPSVKVDEKEHVKVSECRLVGPAGWQACKQPALCMPTALQVSVWVGRQCWDGAGSTARRATAARPRARARTTARRRCLSRADRRRGGGVRAQSAPRSSSWQRPGRGSLWRALQEPQGERTGRVSARAGCGQPPAMGSEAACPD